MIIFDGSQRAIQKEAILKQRLIDLKLAQAPSIAAILFTEDAGSQLYTRLKKEAALRVGIGYEVYPFSLKDDVQSIISQIHQLNQNPAVTGIIIQKPSKTIWLATQPDLLAGEAANQAFQAWWHSLVPEIEVAKDVDGLHPATLEGIEQGTWETNGMVMPATARAIMDILSVAAQELSQKLVTLDYDEATLLSFLKGKKITVLGKSDIVGKPVFYALNAKKCDVEMIGSQELRDRIEQKTYLWQSNVIITSTGREKLITGDLLKLNSVVIDVGEPRPDVDEESVAGKVAFLTPVPGGVGPMTVVSLLENAITLVSK